MIKNGYIIIEEWNKKMNKGRIEAFTDAIVAIAATIMVLELHVPKEANIRGLIEEWPVFLAYIISFSLIYIVWFNHHNLFYKAKFISPRTYLYNGIWLFFLTLVPFTTNWVGSEPNKLLPEFLYVLNILLWTIMFQVMDNSIVKDNPGVAKDETNNFKYRSILYGGYLLAFAVAFIQPILCLFMILIFTVVMAIGFFKRPARSK